MKNRDQYITEVKDSNNSNRKNLSIKKTKKVSSQWCRQVNQFRYLPQTAQRLSDVQRTYGVTVVPDRVLLRSLRPQIPIKRRKLLSMMEKAKAKMSEDSDNVPDEDQHSEAISEDDIPHNLKENNLQNKSEPLSDEDDLSINESSVSLPDSPKASKTPLPTRPAVPKRKKYTKKTKKPKEEEEKVVKKEDKERPKSFIKTRPKHHRKKQAFYARKKFTDFFLNLAQKPPKRHVANPKHKEHERLLQNYYNQCQKFLLAEPQSNVINQLVATLNKTYDYYSRSNFNKSNNIESEEEDEAVKKTLDSSEGLRQNSLNSLKDFDAFVKKTMMESIKKNKKRAQVKSLLKREYSKKYDDISTTSSTVEEEGKGENVETHDDAQNNDSTSYLDRNLPSSVSGNEFSDYQDSPEPMHTSIDKFDNFVAKTIQNHIRRQAKLQSKLKRKLRSGKGLNPYQKWLQRRIFGYRSKRRKVRPVGSNVSNKKCDKNLSKKSNSIFQSSIDSTIESISLDDISMTKKTLKRQYSKEVLLEDILKSMQVR